MKNIKKLSLLVIIFSLLFLMTGCGNKNVEGSLEEIMSSVYENLDDENKPIMLENIDIDEENIEYYLGTDDIEFEEAIASESMTGSIAHSVVLVRVKDKANIEDIKKKIEDNVDPRKWICVEAENVVVKSKGNLIILIMVNDGLEELEKGFDNL